jgi:acyl-CoA hydrolase
MALLLSTFNIRAVDLWGADLVSRAKALISLAHPSKREDLVKAAYDRYKINILSI